MKKVKIITVALGLLVFVAAFQPAEAVCPNARLISSNNTGAGGFSYLFTPGCDSYGASPDACLQGTSITPAFSGTFWAVGEGDATPGAGSDNGTFPAIDWMYIYPNYPVFLNTAWSISNDIDGCIDLTPATCTAIQLGDVNPVTGESVVAVLSAEQDEFKNYWFNQEGDAPIVLAPATVPTIANSSQVGTGDGITVMLDALDAADYAGAIYTDPNCAGTGAGGAEALVPGVQYFAQVVTPRGGSEPTDRNIITGGWQIAGEPVLWGNPATVAISCDPTEESDVWITYSLLNESGMPNPNTVGSATKTECGANIAEPEQRLRVKPTQREVKPRGSKR